MSEVKDLKSEGSCFEQSQEIYRVGSFLANVCCSKPKERAASVAFQNWFDGFAQMSLFRFVVRTEWFTFQLIGQKNGNFHRKCWLCQRRENMLGRVVELEIKLCRLGLLVLVIGD